MIKAIIKKPGESCRIKEISNTLKSFQRIVGGRIQVVPWFDNMAIICNEEGKVNNLPFNIRINGDIICGTVIIAGIEGEIFTDLPEYILDRLSGEKSTTVEIK
jgi:hypothetical protein